MVKLHGPIQSLAASGTIADAVTVSTWKGRHYLKTKSLPTDPKSGAQVGHRLMMAWLSQQWPKINASHRASWTDLAAKTNIDPRSAFIGYNLKRFNLFKGPTKPYPAAEENDFGMPVFGNPNPTDRVHAIETNVDLFMQADTWGYFLFQLPDAVEPTQLSNLIAAYVYDDPGPDVRITTPLAPGSYFFAVRYFTDDGRLSPADPVQAGTVLHY